MRVNRCKMIMKNILLLNQQRRYRAKFLLTEKTGKMFGNNSVVVLVTHGGLTCHEVDDNRGAVHGAVHGCFMCRR